MFPPELEDLKKYIRNNNEQLSVYKPYLFNFSIKSDIERCLKLLKEGLIEYVVDKYDEQYEEVVCVNNPALLLKKMKTERLSVKNNNEGSIWVYYSWNKSLVHILDEKIFSKVRLSRNNGIIGLKEQETYKRANIAIAGLNTGNPVAVCLALEGVGRFIRLADNDVLSLSNLNRFRASLIDLGINKAVLTARQMYEIDPFLNIEVYHKGVEPGKEELFLDNPRIDVLIEEIDDLKLKISLREKAKSLRIPVVMATGNGEDVIVDVERFDIEPDLPLLSGYLNKETIDRIYKLDSNASFNDWLKCARDFIGADYLNKDLRNSFDKVGVSLAGIPQIAETSFVRGASVAYIVRRIVTGGDLPSGRYNVRLTTMSRL